MPYFYDIDRNFTLSAKGDISLATDNSALQQSIRNIILTPRSFKCGFGEVNTIFGVGINRYVFAPLTSFVAQSLGEDVFRQLRLFEPRIEIDNINVEVNLDNRSFEIDILYRILPIVQQFSFRTVINQI